MQIHTRARTKVETVMKEGKRNVAYAGEGHTAVEYEHPTVEDSTTKDEKGSRDSKVIGHTKSGKPIYDSFSHEGHKDFTGMDHLNAAYHHDELSRESYKKAYNLRDNEKDEKRAEEEFAIAEYHYKENLKHHKAADEKGDVDYKQLGKELFGKK